MIFLVVMNKLLLDGLERFERCERAFEAALFSTLSSPL